MPTPRDWRTIEPSVIGGVSALLLLALTAGCGGPQLVEQDGPGATAVGAHTPDAVPRPEPRSRYGNPESYKVLGQWYHPMKDSKGYRERGVASWYGTKFHGRRTSSGEPYDMYAMTAAHKTLPLPTYVRVTNLENGHSAVVKVNDRGPFHTGRIIDLSYAAARRLGVDRKGTAPVEVAALSPPGPGADEAGAAAGVQPSLESAGPPERVLFLQVGAFSSRRNAELLRDRLKEHALDPVQIEAPADEGHPGLYRVRIGPLNSTEAVDQVAERLKALGTTEYRIVSN